jgi:hypothetical protein
MMPVISSNALVSINGNQGEDPFYQKKKKNSETLNAHVETKR